MNQKRKKWTVRWLCLAYLLIYFFTWFPFSALAVLVWQHEGHPAHDKACSKYPQRFCNQPNVEWLWRRYPVKQNKTTVFTWPVCLWNVLIVGRGWETCTDGVAHCHAAGTSGRWRCSTKYSLGCDRWECCPFCRLLPDMFRMQLHEFFHQHTWHICATGGDSALHIAGVLKYFLTRWISYANVLASQCWWKGKTPLPSGAQWYDEERMTPGHCLGLLLRVFFSALTLLLEWLSFLSVFSFLSFFRSFFIVGRGPAYFLTSAWRPCKGPVR